MASIVEMQTQLEHLRSQRARGVRKVSYQGQEVEYRSDAEMAAAIQDLERRIASASGSSVRRTVGGFDRGL